jgi:hypothetical protein
MVYAELTLVTTGVAFAVYVIANRRTTVFNRALQDRANCPP